MLSIFVYCTIHSITDWLRRLDVPLMPPGPSGGGGVKENGNEAIIPDGEHVTPHAGHWAAPLLTSCFTREG